MAFGNEANSRRLRKILESGLGLECRLCHSGGEVRRLAVQQQVRLVITGWMLSDGPTDQLILDLPRECAHILIARPGQLNQCMEGVIGLPAPLPQNDLVSTVRMLLGDLSAPNPVPLRGKREWREIDAAKRLLMDRNHMSEAQAHRFLQKTSMDTCSSMVQTAQRVLDSDKVF